MAINPFFLQIIAGEVKELEDRGFIVDVAVAGVRTFLPVEDGDEKMHFLKSGAIIMARVESVDKCGQSSVIIKVGLHQGSMVLLSQIIFYHIFCFDL